MKPGLSKGTEGTLSWVVDPSLTITLGPVHGAQATVFSTPSMIMLMERAAREALRPFLNPDEESVGIEVHVEHLAGAPLGATVTGRATISRLEDRRIHFEITAWHGDRQLGRGTHVRAVVSVQKIVQNLAKLSITPTPVPAGSTSIEPNQDTSPTFETLRLQVDKKIARVHLNRPRVLNAVNRQMTADIERLVAWLHGQAESIRVVILTGEGEAFCAGDDVKELEGLAMEEARQLSLRQARMYLGFASLPQIFIAAVNGQAQGAGCVCACACDFRLASTAARFGMPEIKLGWNPGYGIAQLTAIVGKPRAMELCLTGRSISPQEAVAWGLANELVPGLVLTQRAQQLAEELLALPATALRETKRQFLIGEGNLPKVAYTSDTELYVRCLETADAREGIRAFVEHRTPRFTGR